MLSWLQNQVVFSAVLSLVLIAGMMTCVAYCIYFERKISAWIQDRQGPNRVGFLGLFGNFHFWGLGQPIADGAKFFLKEDIIPARVDKPLFILAPAISMIVALIGFVVIPWGGSYMLGDTIMNVQVANPDVGLLYILGVGSMGVYGVVLGGWASNNKYSMYGAVRATAQMLSYEIPMGVAILVVVLASGQLRLEEIVLGQVGGNGLWNIVLHPVSFLILLITLFAETNRAPFDLAEAEQELVGGFHTEYSSMKFAMFFLGEYVHMITGSAFICVLFLGGWELSFFGIGPAFPGTGIEDVGLISVIIKIGVLAVKVAFFIFLFMLVRWTLPRFRFDQLMRLAWKGLIPVSLGILVLTVMGVYMGWQRSVLFNLGSEIAIVAATLGVVILANKPVTGRQDNMPVVTQPLGG